MRDKEGFDTSEGPHWTALPKAGRTLLSKGKRRGKRFDHRAVWGRPVNKVFL